MTATPGCLQVVTSPNMVTTLVLFYIHQRNRMNSRNDVVVIVLDIIIIIIIINSLPLCTFSIPLVCVMNPSEPTYNVRELSST